MVAVIIFLIHNYGTYSVQWVLVRVDTLTRSTDFFLLLPPIFVLLMIKVTARGLCTFWWVVWGDEKVLLSFGSLDKKKKKATEKPTHDLHPQDKNKKDQGASASKKAPWAADVKELLDEEEEGAAAFSKKIQAKAGKKQKKS